MTPDAPSRIFYSSSVHDEREIDAVVEVLRSGPQGLWPGRRVVRMEREVAARFGKAHGVMCNSGSSALYLALELLDLPPGAEVVTCALTFSTDVAPIVRGGWVPVFVDCEPLTYCVDVDRIEEMITDRTGALLFPNLIGNAPDWDRIAEIAAAPRPAGDRGLVRHARRDAARHADRRALDDQRHQLRQLAHHHVRGQRRHGDGRRRRGWRDRAVMLRRWGRRSELNFFGSKRRDRDFWEDLDGIHYDNQFIFDEVAWNFEPSELGAAFGLEQLEKLPENLGSASSPLRAVLASSSPRTPTGSRSRAQLPELETAWLGYPLMIEPDAGFERADLQEFLDGRGIDTRTIWTGNVTRQPMLGGVEVRVPPDGLPNADAVMERGVLLPLSHAIDDDTLDVVIAHGGGVPDPPA